MAQDSTWRQWALGVAVSLAGVFGTWAWGSMSDSVKNMEQIMAQRGERQARTEQAVSIIKDQMDRVEGKIDRLLERQGSLLERNPRDRR